MITKPKHHGKKHFSKYCKDFECVLIPSTNKIDFGPNTKKYKDHTKLTLAKILLTNFKRYHKLNAEYKEFTSTYSDL